MYGAPFGQGKLPSLISGSNPFSSSLQDTTGALLLARTPVWARKLQQQFLNRTINKTYLALVHGGQERFPQTSGVIEARLSEKDGRVHLDPEGKETKTEWEVLGFSVRLLVPLSRFLGSFPLFPAESAAQPPTAQAPYGSQAPAARALSKMPQG